MNRCIQHRKRAAFTVMMLLVTVVVYWLVEFDVINMRNDVVRSVLGAH
jgi:hypothetical protein